MHTRIALAVALSLAFTAPDEWLATQKVPVKRLTSPAITLSRSGLPNSMIVLVPAAP